MADRVRFPGDPKVGETGEPGATPKIPLSTTVAPITQELLNQNGDDKEAEATMKDFRPKGKKDRDDDDEDDLSEEAEALVYSREKIGARIGTPVEEAAKVDGYEKALDKEAVVPCMFRTPVHLNHEGLMHHWQPGVHLVPLSIAGDKKSDQKMHWWLRHNRTKRTGPPQVNPKRFKEEEEEV